MQIAKYITASVIITSSVLAAETTVSQQYVEVESFNEIPFSEFTSKDCFAFDLDDTTFIQADKIMRNANFDDRSQFIKDIRENEGDERVTFVYDHSGYQLLEDNLPSHLEALNHRDVNTVAFTARRTGKATQDQVTTVEEDTLKIVNGLGVKFKSSYFQNLELKDMNPNNIQFKEYIVDTRLKPFSIPHDVMVKDGVIFSNNIDKGLVLGEIFEQSGFFPEVFGFVDDKIANHTSVIQAINKVNERFGKNIKCKCYYYTRSFKIDNTLNPDVVALQKSYILKGSPEYLTDQQALRLLNQ